MSSHTQPGDPAAQVHSRVGFQFDGELDDVPVDAAAKLASLTRNLLRHGDGHDGRPATVRMELLGHLLSLWLTDPECSPACLAGSGDLPTDCHDGHGGHGGRAPGETRLTLDSGPEGGLHLHWELVLANTA